MRTGLEVVETGELHVRRKDAAELMRIRAGEWSYEKLVQESESLQERMKIAAVSSNLPNEVDREWVDALAREMIQGMP